MQSGQATMAARAPASAALPLRLSSLMFLQFFVWGSWSVTLGLVLQTVGAGALIADAFSVGPIASIAGSFLLGMAAARFLGPRTLLVVLHLVGGVMLYLLPDFVSPERGGAFLWLLLGYMMLYMPTVGLANTVALKSLGERVDQFPLVRAFGTLGWIAAGLIVGWLGLSASADIFRVAAIASVVLGAYCVTLPDVAPDTADTGGIVRQLLCLDAFELMREHSFLVFIACATAISVPLAMYYSYASPYLGTIGIANVSGALSIGQMSELGCMFAMPWLYRRFGVKRLLLTGMLAWVIRYGLFSIGGTAGLMWPVYLGIALHGICYDFFFVAGAIYTGTIASARGVNAQAQGMLTLFTYGVGMLLGSQIGGWLYAQLPATPTVADWHALWRYPAGAAAVIAIVFQLAFHHDRRARDIP